MKLWEKAKEKYPALSRTDFVEQTCPDLALSDDMTDFTPVGRICAGKYACQECWDREVKA